MRLASVLGVVALAAAPAFAGDLEQREAVFVYGANDPALRSDVEARILPWSDEILDPAKPPKDWDAATLGPWDIVLRRTGHAVDASTPGRVHVIVQINGEGLPSGSSTATALAQRVVAGYRDRITQRATELRGRPLSEAAQALDVAKRAHREASDRVREAERPHGGPPSQRAAWLATRIGTVESDLATSRVDRAVAAKQLEAARAAAERGVALARLRANVEEIERALREKDDPALREKLAALRRTTDEATAKCPSLESARQRVFELEVALVGLETRESVLGEELRALREKAAEIATHVPAYDDLVRALVAAMSTMSTAEYRFAEAARSSPGPVFEVIRDVSPVRTKEK